MQIRSLIALVPVCALAAFSAACGGEATPEPATPDAAAAAPETAPEAAPADAAAAPADAAAAPAGDAATPAPAAPAEEKK